MNKSHLCSEMYFFEGAIICEFMAAALCFHGC